MLRLVLFFALVANTYGWGRIVGGRNAAIENYNWQVSLQWLGSHRCGGILVAPSVVVSAAHCVVDIEKYPHYCEILAGTNNLREGGDVRDVQSLHSHKKYASENDDYDVAVILLKKPFSYSAKIGRVDLIAKYQNIAVGTVADVTGWGATKEGGYVNNILQVVTLPNVNWNVCYSQYGDELTDRMICFGYVEGGRDACQGDSGGPLVVYNEKGNPILAGIVSWGIGCARPNRSGIYAKISHSEIHDFITQYL